ncbi:probable multidrug resistance-associated protein lethal(2)03659 [Tribolium castaneum]|uniref:Putative multidrug resistance-associated protein lethal(2)03659-like Protein n=1 Tax=Tribolium castaneum TaxID=7070 RepID=D6WJW1_TRICA|nr:PREDICTED: multidrug resistance-associated protein 4 [Tribolium castaneum]EFA03656.1 putative multidrug resistance-associated protein lethal(2)03659-like Protein [Tribolium castaneum]|eukprot:XP_008193119.1 PREDICTED: multidrug resistance-associated protein 4 [Tribolium castaneum]
MEDNERKSLKAHTKVHPKEKANFLSTLFFCWALPTFVKGWKKDLDEDDLYGPLKAHESKALADRMGLVWLKEKNKHRIPSLGKVIIKVFYREILFYACFLMIQELVIKMAQPLLVGKLLEYYAPDQQNMTKNVAYMYASALIFFIFSNIFIQHSCFLGMQHLAMKMQVACRSLIYRKALTLNKNALMKSTVGQMVNLMSSDVSKFSYICLHVHQMILAPIQTVIVLYLLFSTVNTAAMVGVGLLIVFIPIQFYMGKLTSFYRRRTAQKTDNRIRLMNEIICGIKIIKMFTWEKPFSKLVEMARRLELHEIKANSYLRTVYRSVNACLIPLSIFLCVLTYVLSGNTLQAQFVFVVTSFYGTLRQTLTLHFPRCIALLAEINVSLGRIQNFLLAEETQKMSNELRTDDVRVILTEAGVKWTDSSDYSLSDVSFSVNCGELVAVIGRVGSGKSTLLQAILREIDLSKGELVVSGSVSYAAQEPWIFSSSIRQNILFGEKMNFERYKEVVKVCALEKDFNLFPYGDRTIVGEKGVMLSGGQKARVSLARAIYKDADIYLLDDPLSAVDTHVGKQLFDQCILGFLKDKARILVTHQIQYLGKVDEIYLLDRGQVTLRGTYDELKKHKDFAKLLAEVEQTPHEDCAQEKHSVAIAETSKLPTEVKEQRSSGTISKKVYLHYFRAGDSRIFPSFVLLTFVVTQIASSCVDYFLTFWVNLEQKRLEGTETLFFTTNTLLYMYVFLIVSLTFMVLVNSVSFVKFSMNTCKKLHEKMFAQILNATMRFFNTNPSGRVLNRFSKDTSLVDESVPPCLSDTIHVALNVVAITIVISSVNTWIIIPTILIFGLFYGYKTIFLATSRNLKRIEGTARSPMFSHLTASLQGLATIRAFDAEDVLRHEFDNIQNHHSSALYMYIACSRTFAFWLDVNCVIYVAIVILSFLFIGTEKYGGNVGLAITQSIALTGMLQRGIRQWSDLQNQMTSVERIFEYTQVPSEPDHGKKIPPKDWPSAGNIDFNDVSMKYSLDGPYVLKNLNCRIASSEKIGIVGRTGAGKSSLISALFRLALTEGKITIDGVETSEIPLNHLRSAISIIPQEAVLFSGTLRKNLDPFDKFSDEELWNALDQVELKSAISELAAGLSSAVSEEGSNFSVGEKQLLCLARAILHRNKILILDEATANVDLQTDELIQKTIRRKFRDCTVLTIAHRLFTVIDSDKILVLDNGSIVEMDHPHLLLQNTDGVFYNLVKQTGRAMAENLTKMAHENYMKRIS